MGPEIRLSLFLKRVLYASAIVSALAISACGDDPVDTDTDPSGADDDADDDDADDDADDDEPPPAEDDDSDDDVEPPPGDDDDDEPVKPMVDARAPTVMRDAGVDARSPTTPPQSDATTTPPSRTDGGGAPPVDPPASGDCLCRGEAPTEASASANGPYMVKTYTSGYPDSPAYADSTIHYPEGATPPFAIVTVVPGFVSPQSSIRPWGPFLASHGIVTMTIGTNSTSDQPPARATALLGALKTLEGENARSGSPLMGKLDLKRQAVMGWSMGGGGTLLAGEQKGDLKALISLCGWNPGHNYSKIKSPSLMFAATSDPLAGGQSQGFYSTIPMSVPKMLFEVSGGSHQYANNPTGHMRLVGRYGLSWMKTYLEDDMRYKQFLTKGKPAGLAAYVTNVM
jgi:dienelactone hydrolase